MEILNFKRLMNCTLLEAVSIYNAGFTGYEFDKTLSVDQFAAKIGNERISAEMSIIAYYDKEPVGIVLSGIRDLYGTKVGWNGGTGVSPEFRGKGYSKLLVLETLNIYRKMGLKEAALDSLSNNIIANKLYSNMGYRVIDEGLFLSHHAPPTYLYDDSYSIYKYGTDKDVSKITFNSRSPWELNWSSLRDRESITLLDTNNNEMCYLLFKRVWDQENNLKKIMLFQCEVDCNIYNARDTVLRSLNYLFNSFPLSIDYSTYNFPKNNHLVIQILKELGFKVWAEEQLMLINLLKVN